jgi:hypothetical protein
MMVKIALARIQRKMVRDCAEEFPAAAVVLNRLRTAAEFDLAPKTIFSRLFVVRPATILENCLL